MSLNNILIFWNQISECHSSSLYGVNSCESVPLVLSISDRNEVKERLRIGVISVRGI